MGYRKIIIDNSIPERNGIMNQKRTFISENNISFLKGEERTPRQIADFLQTDAVFRSFVQILSPFCQEDLKEKLTEGLAELTNEGREQTARKVRNWINGKNLPKNRETIFQICFVLKLTESDSSKVLGMLSDTGIHYRNPKELAYAYALRTGLPYQKAEELAEQAAKLASAVRSGEEEKGDTVRTIQRGYTRQLQALFEQVTDEESFFAFIRENGKQLGRLHDTAYCKFMELLELLQQPFGSAGEEEAYFTLDQVMEQYLRMHVPLQMRSKKSGSLSKRAASAELTALQKLVKRCWPNEGELVRMRKRKEDVSRKTLLLLYLVTEAFDLGGGETEDYYDLEDLEEDADTMLEIRWKRMDLFLDTYGMNHLDPGNPFDFLVLYALRAQGDDSVQERMDQMLDFLFS